MKWFLRIAIVIVLLLLVAGAWMYSNMRDRYSGYTVNMNVESAAPGSLSAGFAKMLITPDVVDTWNDVNGDATYNEDDGDTFNDNNHNGVFDAVWIAGFHPGRAANGVHDDLWARAAAFDDGNTRIVIVAIDAIGFFHDDVIAVRQKMPESAGIDYLIVASTHVHEAPDLMGLWGAKEFESGVDPEYHQYVITQAAAAAQSAAANLRPAILRTATDPSGALPLVNDSRKPLVYDEALLLLQAIDARADTTLGTLFAWGDHPETLWSDNLLISSDFPHYVREFTEKGVFHGDSLQAEGLGGITVFVNGAIGGLMTTDLNHPIKDPFVDTTYVAPSFDKARAQGQQLALLGLAALKSPDVYEIETGTIRLYAETIDLPVDNPIFRLGAMFGLLNRGFKGWMNVRSEIGAWSIGDLSFVTVPGEIYPEIINGGVEAPAGQDFDLEPVELPPLRDEMPGRYKFVLGLANDEVGYIIPKSQWDEEAPHTYGAHEAPYGEINSLGPETAPILHRELLRIIRSLKK